jgi:nucleotide-binding universal stress UspA family protein
MEPIRTIVAPTDLRPGSQAAVAYAADLAQQLKARLLVLHVEPAEAIVPGSDLAQREHQKDHADMATVVRDLEARGVEVSGRVVPGIPEDDIVTIAAEEKADLIVVGWASGSGLAQALFGNVASRVLRHAPCPVVTVRVPEVPCPLLGHFTGEGPVFHE